MVMIDIVIDGDAAKTHRLDYSILTNKESRDIERFTGMFIDDFQDATVKKSPTDFATVLVWLALNRSGNAALALEDVSFNMNTTSISAELDPTEEPSPDAAVPLVADPTQPPVPAAVPDGVPAG